MANKHKFVSIDDFFKNVDETYQGHRYADASSFPMDNVTHCAHPDCTDSRSLGTPMCRVHALQVFDLVTAGIPYDELEKRIRFRPSHLREVAETAVPQKKSARDEPGTIYYVKVGSFVKIGFTKDLDRRMASYPPDSKLLAVHPGTLRMERAIHARFCADLMERREWFADSERIRDHIARVVEEYGYPQLPGRKKPAPRPKVDAAVI